MVERFHLFDGLEFERTLRVGNEQGSLACDRWDHKESNTTELLN